MKTLISFTLQSNQLSLFKKLWKFHSIFSKKYKTNVWKDNHGNTLMHYVCMHHNLELLNFIKDEPKNLTLLNNEGKAPIHIFIERAFFYQGLKGSFEEKIKDFAYNLLYFINNFIIMPKKLLTWLDNNRMVFEKEVLGIDFSEEVLKEIVNAGADVNQFMEFPDRKEMGWNSSDYGAFSIKDNMGTPIELLVYYFWGFILYPNLRNDSLEDISKKYELFFHALTKVGANINLIIKGNTNDSTITDAMESYPSRIVSIFFMKFLLTEIDYIAIKPFLEDEHIDFLTVDDDGNNILHTLFARLSIKKDRFPDELCNKIIQSIAQNKNFNIACIELENYSHITPVELLRKEALHLRKFFSSYLLHENLQGKLNTLTQKKKVTKI